MNVHRSNIFTSFFSISIAFCCKVVKPRYVHVAMSLLAVNCCVLRYLGKAYVCVASISSLCASVEGVGFAGV